MQSEPSNGEFRISPNFHLNETTIQHSNATTEHGKIVLKGRVNDVNKTIAALEFRPGCIFD